MENTTKNNATSNGALYTGISSTFYQPSPSMMQTPRLYDLSSRITSTRPTLSGIGADFIPRENIANKFDYLRTATKPTIFY